MSDDAGLKQDTDNGQHSGKDLKLHSGVNFIALDIDEADTLV